MELLYYLEVNLLVVHWGWVILRCISMIGYGIKRNDETLYYQKMQPIKVTENILIFKFKTLPSSNGRKR